jgi:mRNA-degrading endonuclease RelE of RelBE toxin-antitoxin system
MRHEIIFAPMAIDDLRSLRAFDRAAVKDAIEQWLRFEPERVSKSRIKRLRKMKHPQYRLRVGEYRVHYDVTAGRVVIVSVVLKSDAEIWLQEYGVFE